MSHETNRGDIIDFQAAKEKLERRRENRPEQSIAQKSYPLPDVLRREVEYGQQKNQASLTGLDGRMAKIRQKILARGISSPQVLDALATMERNAAEFKLLPPEEQMKGWQEFNEPIHELEVSLGLVDSESLKAVLGPDIDRYRIAYAGKITEAEQRLAVIDQNVQSRLRGLNLLQAQKGLAEIRKGLLGMKEMSVSEQMQLWDRIDRNISDIEKKLGIKV